MSLRKFSVSFREKSKILCCPDSNQMCEHRILGAPGIRISEKILAQMLDAG